MEYHAKGTRILTQIQFFSSYSSLKDNPPVWVRGWLVLVARCSLRCTRSYLGPRRHSPKSFTSWLVLITSTTTHIHLNATYTRKNYLIAPSFNSLCLYQTMLHGKLNLKAVTFFPLDCLKSLTKIMQRISKYVKSVSCTEKTTNFASKISPHWHLCGAQRLCSEFSSLASRWQQTASFGSQTCLLLLPEIAAFGYLRKFEKKNCCKHNISHYFSRTCAAANCFAVTPRTEKMVAKCLFLILSNILSLQDSCSLVAVSVLVTSGGNSTVPQEMPKVSSRRPS